MTTRVFPVRMRPEERALFTVIKERNALLSLADAVRFAGRVVSTMPREEAKQREALYLDGKKLEERSRES